jgi:tungstate transport system substrate-binding protein
MCSAPTSAKLPKACRVFTSLAANELRPNNPGVWVKIESALKRANQGHRIGRFSRTAHMHSRRNTTLAFIALFGVTFFSAVQALAQEKSIVVASTTSTQDSGLFEYLLPIFQQKTGIAVKVIDQGTGQALDTGRRGDAFVHAKSAEEKFLAEGQGVKRYPVMYNDFILIGPKSDPAGIKGKDVIKAFRTIKEKQAPFVSRGDRSGTHIAELALWNKDAGIEIEKEKGTWYKSIGQGMGAALNMASASNAYVLSDRGTWLSFKNKCDLQIIVEGDKRLFNQYGVILVNPEKHPSVKKDLCQQFIDWLVSPDGQKAIANYKINGEQLFHPNADDPNA